MSFSVRLVRDIENQAKGISHITTWNPGIFYLKTATIFNKQLPGSLEAGNKELNNRAVNEYNDRAYDLLTSGFIRAAINSMACINFSCGNSAVSI